MIIKRNEDRTTINWKDSRTSKPTLDSSIIFIEAQDPGKIQSGRFCQVEGNKGVAGHKWIYWEEVEFWTSQTDLNLPKKDKVIKDLKDLNEILKGTWVRKGKRYILTTPEYKIEISPYTNSSWRVNLTNKGEYKRYKSISMEGNDPVQALTTLIKAIHWGKSVLEMK